MNLLMTMLAAAVVAVALSGAAMAQDYPIQAVPFTDVKVEDGFWSPRLEVNRRVTIPYAFKMCEETGRIENFEVAAGRKQGGMKGYCFNDSDVYKVIEGAAYSLAIHPDPKLEEYCDRLIDTIAAAQEPDGYLYCSRTIMDPKNPPRGGKERWSDMAHGHELYCAGHLYEAAVAYRAATGKRRLLDVAIKNADLVVSIFGPGKNPHPCGHPEIEIALVKLYRETGTRAYLDLAKFFIDTRGKSAGRALYGEYSQDHSPLLEQKTAVGHAVRAAYLFAGMADVAAMTGERPYIEAIGRLWDDVVGTKMYLTGGIGSRGSNEGFGEAYELPNASAYSETCASIASAMWNHRMLLTHGDAKYADALERVVYNAFLSGWSLKGDRFFYPNPLESPRGAPRQAWFACACCPSNVVRFVPSVPGYVYARRGNDLYVNLFIGGEASVGLDSGEVRVRQQTGYPWDGGVLLSINPERPARFAVRVRIPGWARGEAVPGGLYRFTESFEERPSLTVNQKPVDYRLDKGYAVVEREWKAGDSISLILPMPVRRVAADQRISQTIGKVAFQRGPLVYCFEGKDQLDPEVLSFVVDERTAFLPWSYPTGGGNMIGLRGRAKAVTRKLGGGVEIGEEIEATAIPYFAWANAEPSPMTVWVATDPSAANPKPAPTLARRAKASSSFGGDLSAISDQIEPSASNDQGTTRLPWWPKRGTTEWVQYDFDKAVRISGVEVYWFDDTGRGECRIPASWTLMAKVKNEWREVLNPSGYGVELNRFNTCRFDEVEAEGLRIEVQGREGFAGGIYEWRVLEAIGPGEQVRATPVAPIMTRWAKDLDPDAPLPAYPRPQLAREDWLNLNGRWQWRAAKANEDPPVGQDLGGTIIVPFPVESALSGVMEHHERLWYRRLFEVPADWRSRRVLLNFGAVDWETTVLVNGQKVGEHRGGYDPFTFDITTALKDSGSQEIIVGVFDPTDGGDQPRGKQNRKPHGIWYTPCTGIWQTVWLEPVLESRIESLTITPSLAGKTVRVRANTAGDPAGASVRVSVAADGRSVWQGIVKPNQDAMIEVPEPRAWSPESPFLYDLSAELVADGTTIDRITSYFGLRDISVDRDEAGVNRMFLNGKPCFQVGPLDQGYWPDGVYTAPTDAALRFDVEETKRLGFNMARKHVKVEPARWYYWADRLGLLVWQDMPSPLPPNNTYTKEGMQQFEVELRALVQNLYNHPSIVMWVVFNEGWGQFDTPRLTDFTRQLDATRLVNNASGWTDAGVGHVIDIHNYPDPKAPPTESTRAAVLGEYGGLGLPVPGHMWKEENWGYKAMASPEALTRKYEQMMKRVYELRDTAGLAAAVYTQTTDVEIEANGLLTYDRAILKVDAGRVAAANRGDFSRMPPPPVVTVVVPTSQDQPQGWRYTASAPANGWEQPGFDDSAWNQGPGGFGTRGTPGAAVGTVWDGREIWIRRAFEWPASGAKSPHLRLHHDEDCEVHLNGVLAAKLNGYTTEYEDVPLPAAAAAALKPGRNVIAIRCRQTRGGQYIDAGIVDLMER